MGNGGAGGAKGDSPVSNLEKQWRMVALTNTGKVGGQSGETDTEIMFQLEVSVSSPAMRSQL